LINRRNFTFTCHTTFIGTNFDPGIGVGVVVDFRSIWLQLPQSKLKHFEPGIIQFQNMCIRKGVLSFMIEVTKNIFKRGEIVIYMNKFIRYVVID
jgi:hypothetical protein